MDDKITALDIELACYDHFDYRRNVIVPNVFWGLGFRHEIDVLVLRPSGYGVEIEIKVSKSDLKRDLKKRGGHGGAFIREVYFAVPTDLAETAIEIIKPEYGVLAYNGDLQIIRKPKSMSCRKCSDSERAKLLHLGVMRVVRLKQQLSEK